MNKIKEILKKALNYLYVIIVSAVCFIVGYYFNFIVQTVNGEKHKDPKFIGKDEVTLAIDEYDNLILIDKGDGSYNVYQDSVGISIFNLYAKSIWNSHTKTTNEKTQ
jgi:hypothetical protein